MKPPNPTDFGLSDCDLGKASRIDGVLTFRFSKRLYARQTLKRELLVLDWKQRQTTRAGVQVAIEVALDRGLPDAYDRALFARKTAAVFEHVFSAYQGDGRSIYEAAA